MSQRLSFFKPPRKRGGGGGGQGAECGGGSSHVGVFVGSGGADEGGVRKRTWGRAAPHGASQLQQQQWTASSLPGGDDDTTPTHHQASFISLASTLGSGELGEGSFATRATDKAPCINGECVSRARGLRLSYLMRGSSDERTTCVCE